MDICNAHDTDIAYDARKCPACELQKSLDEALEQIKTLTKEYNELSEELHALSPYREVIQRMIDTARPDRKTSL